MKIAIIEDNSLMAEMLKDMVTEQPDWELVGIADNGDDGIGLIRAKRPDIVLLDLILPKSDGFFVLKTIRAENIPVKFLALSSLNDDGLIEKALRYGASYYMIKPFQFDQLKERICDVTGMAFHSAPAAGAAAHVKSLDEKLSDIFLQLGMQIKLQGFHFVRDCIKIAARRPDTQNNMKSLYDEVGKIYGKAAEKVERCIRHLVLSAIKSGKFGTINTFFAADVYTPPERMTNAHFIALWADKIRMNCL
ncbi:response regulator [Candidatus Borkfalkia ceftriaxoniphila]|jgi:two-component system, sporulation family, response regulator, stage 0 sporulation protein A|uniref:Stage 0 sporulation protein A homolog n=1 Tax=Candidatus Borkfalkia ceftriaxoniphila TaxID=2508949 RepID=A0A4Q2KC74_9FIRM|nr:response regulator [Candidatus Borkfalkia ceftriaxoniphila]RXZ62175.1 response regulator [Candidatus Borkfalkia ceftriaxoniphila]